MAIVKHVPDALVAASDAPLARPTFARQRPSVTRSTRQTGSPTSASHSARACFDIVISNNPFLLLASNSGLQRGTSIRASLRSRCSALRADSGFSNGLLTKCRVC